MQDLKDLLTNVSANPAKLEFPRDTWGFTSAVKKTVLLAASAVKGNKEKHDLLVAVLAILIQHLVKRQEPDSKTQAERVEVQKAAADELRPRQSFGVIKPVTPDNSKVI